MPSMLDLLTPANVVYADRVRALSPTSVQYDPAVVFERAEPGLKVHSVFESYDDNYFLCEHADDAGWSFITVRAPCDHRGQPQRLAYLGHALRDELFEAWLYRPAPQPITALMGEASQHVNGYDLNTDPREEDAQVVMLLRAVGPDADALRTLAALGTWSSLNMQELNPEVLTGHIESIVFRDTSPTA
jgi:hypothetical protein